jgi:hypothetical protein
MGFKNWETNANNLLSFKDEEMFSVGIVPKLTYPLQTYKFRGFSLQANYTDRSTAACRRN